MLSQLFSAGGASGPIFNLCIKISHNSNKNINFDLQLKHFAVWPCNSIKSIRIIITYNYVKQYFLSALWIPALNIKLTFKNNQKNDPLNLAHNLKHSSACYF